MSEIKIDEHPKISKEPSVTEEDKNILQGARNSGDKLALLDTLVVEGKFSDQPLVSVQAIGTEVELSPNELITAAVANAHSPEIKISQDLTPEKRTDLLNRTLSERPDMTVGELRATCRLLQLPPGPFVEKHIAQQTEQVKETLDNGLRHRSLQKIIQTFTYFPKEDIALIRDQFAQQYGGTIEKNAMSVFQRPGDRLSIEIALLGKPQSRSEEEERLRAQIEYEERQRSRYRLFAPRPMTDGLKKARKALDDLELLKTKDLRESDENSQKDAFVAAAYEALFEYKKSLSRFSEFPEIWMCLLAILIVEILLYLLGGKQLALGAPIAIIIWGILSGTLWHIRSMRIRRAIMATLTDPRLPPNYVRARAKSAGIKMGG